jgi:hypothetical protein
MKKSNISLDQINIASPCPMQWEELAGDERKRFCAQCGLNVYNISAMTKAEAESFIANAEGRICAKLYRRADGAIMTRDCPVGLRAVRKKVSGAAAAAFSALVSLFGASTPFAQQQQPKDESRVDIQRTLRRYGQAAVEGTIFDITRAAIPGTHVKLINERTKRETTTRANDSGRFRFADLEPGSYTLHAESPGFIKLTFSHLNLAEEEALNLDVSLKVGDVTMGIVIDVSPSLIPTNDTILPGKLIRKERPRE